MPIEPNPYDRPDLIALRKGQDDPIILYLVVRESLGMGAGKIAAQAGHAVQMFMAGHHALVDQWAATGGKDPEDDRKVQLANEWFNTSYRKVVLKADDKEWEKIKEQLWCFVVKDAGLTEVDAGSETVLALWPMRKSEAPKIVKRLQVLK